jgi:hypothetical protein
MSHSMNWFLPVTAPARRGQMIHNNNTPFTQWYDDDTTEIKTFSCFRLQGESRAQGTSCKATGFPANAAEVF